ncbi:MAG: hypothetical protein J0L70_27180 [Leptolyngbya sp. UWPOB_LEPTO1]|uniref:hypothetical protein n=1 Tax=Leptolyngbya sp. UWPOB_LEPTO1 TaxID=2815653 RepID=UPI001AD3571E|nr:hypothetical protein [Leptolyngbya sp. UWPOB_LEPTO1]MBN8564221.1 hypothetical protein [Leptolyngbya sp. UWPOB_LEPTO1]
MELILGAIVVIIVLWLLIADLIKPPTKKPKKTREQELADAVRKFMQDDENKK